MFIGHFPSGYVFGHFVSNATKGTLLKHKYILLACILGAMAPDLDMLYFYLIDNRQTNHHKYWSHYPVIWLALGITTYAIHRAIKYKAVTLFCMFFVGGGLLHLLLDSIVGDIWWFAPFVNKSYALFSVPAVYKPWWLNFILHWSFTFEIIISFVAISIWKMERNNA